MRLWRCGVVLLWAALAAVAGHRYEIEATADPAHDRIAGTVRLTFRNETGRWLEEVALRGVGTIRRVSDRDGEVRQTGSVVRLRAPLEPGRETVLVFEFEGAFPVGGYGYRLLSGAWHPKAQTFRKGAFSAQQEQADEYELRLTVPAGEVAAVAGRRLEERALPDGSRRVHTVLENATSLGLAMSAQFRETARQAGGVDIRVYRLSAQSEWGEKLAELAADIVPFYEKLAGFYPHPWLVVLPGGLRSRGGYPVATGMVAIHNLDGTAADFPTWILAHEIGHQYWGFETVIDDGDYYHWPGIAMGIWMDRQYMEARGLGRRRHDAFLNSDYLPAVYAGRDTTLRRTWDEIRKLDFDFNNAVAHGKSYSVVQMLEEVMGAARFRELAVRLQKEYRFRFLSHEDFEKTAEAVQGEPLGWFFRDWVDSNRKLGYEIAGVKHEGGRVTIEVRQTGDAALALPVAVRTADGRVERLVLKRAAGAQTLSFASAAAPVFAAIDPDHRFPVYSPDARHVWGRKVEVGEVRWPEAMAWGTNQAQVVLRNGDDRAHQVNVHIQANTRSGGWGWDTQHRLEAGETKSLERDFIVKPFPGSYTVRLQAHDEDGLLLKYVRAQGEFPAGSDRVAALRVPAWARGELKAEYPRLKLVAGGNVFLYYLEGDAWLEQHASELLAERERYFQELRGRLNPSYGGKVTVLLFPDAESKRAWTGHIGKGWAVGEMLVEIRNAKESVDPSHELVHVICHALGEPPAVLSEGLAVYFQEGQRWDGRHVDAWAKAFAAGGLLWPVARIGALGEIGPQGTQPAITYPEAGSLVKFLIERVGWEKFLAGYRALGAPEAKGTADAAQAAFEKHFGMDAAGLEREWRAALAASTVEPAPAEAVERVKRELK